jgi:UDP-glucose:O-linked fucose beta-1,3-glucosyltransferase
MMLPLLVVIILPVIQAGTPVLFVIQTQPSAFHQGLAEKTKNTILQQWDMLTKNQVPPEIILSTEFGVESEFAWTYFPIITQLAQKLEENPGVDFVGILRENTALNLGALGRYAQNNLGKNNPKEENIFYGKGLKDEAPSIVHHFHQNSEEETILYPDPEAGIFLSRHLVQQLSTKLPEKQDFNIDAEFELAAYLLRNLEVKLTHIPELCSKAPSAGGASCITHPRIKDYKCLKTKEVEKSKDLLASIYTLISTVQKYHGTRVPKISETYGDLLPNAHYISDVEEVISETVTTVVLPHTVNTETGHCNKTRTMLDSFLESGKNWMLILDDDTILSPARLSQLLACYADPADPVILGQRYGYGAGTGSGYNYITGGGGKIMNREAALKIVQLKDQCMCPSADSPEDMHIFGICAAKAAIPILHSHRMFQARPPDYSHSMISPRKPISFHKHWEIDPVEVYTQWFKKSDDYLRAGKKSEKDEL